MVKSTISSPFTSSNGIVPELPQTATTVTLDHDHSHTDDISLVELDPKKQQLEHLGPSLSELQDADPFLVFLCYRGFNHISGKVQNGKAVKGPTAV